MENNPLDRHNHRAIDAAAAKFIQCARRAVTEAPHGSLTVKLEWRACQAHRLVISEDRSEILPVESTGA